jgi:hypothetical protein
MTYEIAKQLKDAGFPQKLHERIAWYTAKGYEIVIGDEMVGEVLSDARVSVVKSPTDGRDDVYVPTLSELIEVCGNKIYRMERQGDGQWAVLENPCINLPKRQYIFPELDVAVAHLWLALKQPKETE